MSLLRSRLRRLHQDERGQIILAFALMFVVLLGFTAMVSDAGIAYWNRRILQNGVDSAALAGAGALSRGESENDAIATARAYANQSGITDQEIDAVTEDAFKLQVTTTYNDNDTVVVSARRQYNFGLRYIVGGGNADIVATASAIAAPVNPGPADLLPWALPQDAPCYDSLDPGAADKNPPPADPTLCSVHLGDNGQSFGPGNFGAISYPDDSGASDYGYDIQAGYPGAVPTPTSISPPTWDWTFDTNPGEMTGSTKKPVQQLRDWDSVKLCHGQVDTSGKYIDGTANDCSNLYQPSPGAASDPDPYQPLAKDASGNPVVCITSTACPRVGIIPIVKIVGTKSGGTMTVKVTGFQCFYVQGYDKDTKLVNGFFLGSCTPSANGADRQADYGGAPNSTGELGVFLWR